MLVTRAVICKNGNMVAVSIDHKPNQSDERQRIEYSDGFVMWASTWRVGGVLVVSRAFGDKLLKQFVVVDPEIQEEEIVGSMEFLILASDGLWDMNMYGTFILQHDISFLSFSIQTYSLRHHTRFFADRHGDRNSTDRSGNILLGL
ncbi:hypothetical protein R6Q59_013690 [Mikania micrantha]